MPSPSRSSSSRLKVFRHRQPEHPRLYVIESEHARGKGPGILQHTPFVRDVVAEKAHRPASRSDPCAQVNLRIGRQYRAWRNRRRRVLKLPLPESHIRCSTADKTAEIASQWKYLLE